MNKLTIHRTLSALALPLALSACGDIEADPDTAVSEGRASEYFELSKLELSSSDAPTLHHPMLVSVEGELRGEDYRTDLLIGMRSTDGSAGCVLGAMPVERSIAADEGADEVTPYAHTAEFVLGDRCFALLDRDDVEIFASFDPWARLGDNENDIEAIGDATAEVSTYDIIAAAALSVEGCETCETTYVVRENPGLDAQLRELNLSSAVAVIPVAGDSRVEPATATDRPDLSVTAASRVTGLATGEGLDAGLVHLRHAIRPLGSSDAGLPLQIILDADEGEVPVAGYGEVTSISALKVTDAARDAIVDGAWSELDEFELVTCVDTDFDQAIFPGEPEARANDCAALPIVVVRELVGEDGLALPNTDPGAATARSAETWGGNWGANAGYGFGYSGIDFQMWLDVNSSDSAATTHKGINVYSAGSWFEAGASSTATVFGNAVDIVDIYATFIGYEFGGGGVAMGASIFTSDFITPFEIQLADGVPVTLQNMFDAAGLNIDPTLTTSYSVAGVNFDDGCGSVTAGVFVDGTVGIDTDLTSITASTTQQGVEISGTVNPFFDISARAEASVHYSDFVSGGIWATLSLLRLDVPFTVSAEGVDYDGLNLFRLTFNESASAILTTLAGSIGFTINWSTFWSSGSHDHTIVEWDGITLANTTFFSAQQVVNIGSQSPGGWCTHTGSQMHSGDFNGDGQLDLLCHDDIGRKWIDFGNNGSYAGTDWHLVSGWCTGDSEFHVGDFNGDGKDDILCKSAWNKWIDYADVNGQFHGTDWTVGNQWCAYDRLTVGDYNNDGRSDLYCFRNSDGYKWLDYTNANGQFDGTDWSGAGALPQNRTRLLNVAAGTSYLNMPGGNIGAGSAHEFIAAPASGGYFAIRNGSNWSEVLHAEWGPAQIGGLWEGAHSMHWTLEPVSGKPKTFRLRNRYRGTYLRIDSGNITLGSAAGTQAEWVFDADVLNQ